MNRSEPLMRTILALASGALAGTMACGGRSTGPGGGGAGGDGGSASETATGGASNASGTGGAAPTGGSSSGGTATGGGPACSNGGPAELCGTLDELEDYVASYYTEGAPRPRPEFTECPARDVIRDTYGCCNPADSGPEVRGERCCYQFCEPSGCCGRAFSVGDEARVAPVTERNDWLVTLDERFPAELDAETSAVIGRLWLRDAQTEHASIASFARFTLELLALGAPAKLVEQAQRAMLEEIEHAKLCFGVAARFLRSPVGPAALELAGAEPRVSLHDAAAAAVVEGCVGETIAALVASEQRARCENAALAAVLHRIAEDETRHAALAFEFVAWALAAGDFATRRAVERALDRAVARARRAVAPSTPSLDEATLGRYGRLTPEELQHVTLRALDDVVLPCARALFEAPDAETPLQALAARPLSA